MIVAIISCDPPDVLQKHDQELNWDLIGPTTPAFFKNLEARLILSISPRVGIVSDLLSWLY